MLDPIQGDSDKTNGTRLGLLGNIIKILVIIPIRI